MSDKLQYLKDHPNTKSLRTYTDTWDLEWIVVAKDLEEFDRIMTDVITKFSHLILEKEKLAIVRNYHNIKLPHVFRSTKAAHPKAKLPVKKIKLDEKDYNLLRNLAVDCRQSSYELGKKLKLSPDAVMYRMKRLIEAGIISIKIFGV